MSEFDVYSRDDLIAEIESLRLKFKRDAKKAIDEACIEAIAELNEVRQQYIRDTLPDAQRDVEFLLNKYDEWLKENEPEFDVCMPCFFERDNLLTAYRKLKEFIKLEELKRVNVTASTPKVRSTIRLMLNKVMNWFKGGDRHE